MGLIVDPHTWADDEVSDAAKANARHSTAYNEINGNLGDANFGAADPLDGSKVGIGTLDGNRLIAQTVPGSALVHPSVGEDELDYSNAKLIRGATTGLKFARGTKSYDMTSGSADIPINLTVTFATDCDDGNPAFSEAPRMDVQVRLDSDPGVHLVAATIRSLVVSTMDVVAGSAHIYLMAAKDSVYNYTIYLDWKAVGK